MFYRRFVQGYYFQSSKFHGELFMQIISSWPIYYLYTDLIFKKKNKSCKISACLEAEEIIFNLLLNFFHNDLHSKHENMQVKYSFDYFCHKYMEIDIPKH